MGKGAFGRHHLRNLGRPGYGDRWVSCTGKPADVDNGGLAAAATVATEKITRVTEIMEAVGERAMKSSAVTT